MPTKAVNIRYQTFDVYIGRAGHGFDGYFGNPFTVREHGRGHALRLYRRWFLDRVEKDPVFRSRVLELREKRLGCFCKPRPCHGDVIAEWIDAQTEITKHE